MRAFMTAGLLFAVGCGSSGDATPDAIITSYNCAADTRGETFTPGLEKMGTAHAYDFKLMTASPAPPLRGDNSWVVEIDGVANDVVGAPAAGLESDITVRPYMPDHQHGSPITVEVTPVAGQPGQYTFDPVNLWMPGLWQTTIEITSGTTVDKAVYSFCLSS